MKENFEIQLMLKQNVIGTEKYIKAEKKELIEFLENSINNITSSNFGFDLVFDEENKTILINIKEEEKTIKELFLSFNTDNIENRGIIIKRIFNKHIFSEIIKKIIKTKVIKKDKEIKINKKINQKR
jgi:hypothetical protein